MNEQQAIARALQAQTELELTREAMAAIRATALEELIRTPPDQTRKIDRLIMTAQIMDAVRKSLETMVAEKDVAQARIELSAAGIFRPV